MHSFTRCVNLHSLVYLQVQMHLYIFVCVRGQLMCIVWKMLNFIKGIFLKVIKKHSRVGTYMCRYVMYVYTDTHTHIHAHIHITCWTVERILRSILQNTFNNITAQHKIIDSKKLLEIAVNYLNIYINVSLDTIKSSTEKKQTGWSRLKCFCY